MLFKNLSFSPFNPFQLKVLPWWSSLSGSIICLWKFSNEEIYIFMLSTKIKVHYIVLIVEDDKLFVRYTIRRYRYREVRRSTVIVKYGLYFINRRRSWRQYQQVCWRQDCYPDSRSLWRNHSLITIICIKIMYDRFRRASCPTFIYDSLKYRLRIRFSGVRFFLIQGNKIPSFTVNVYSLNQKLQHWKRVLNYDVDTFKPLSWSNNTILKNGIE